MLLYVIGWVAGAIIVAVIADARGHPLVPSLIIGLALSPLVALILIYATKPERAIKTCPQCAETVKVAAKVCRFCQHRFDDGP